MGAINHFSTICLPGMALSNLLVYLIFISIYKPYGRYKSFQYNMFAKVWRSQTYWFILFLSPQDVVYTSHDGAMNHFKYNTLAKCMTLSNLPV